MSIGEYFKVKRTLFLSQIDTICRYSRKNIRFALSDLLIGFSSFFVNPYRLARKRGEIYGETPYRTFHKIASLCDLTSKDTWLELGSGRGKGCFWMAHFVGCKVIGIEKILPFSWISRLVKAVTRTKVSFIQNDFLTFDFSKATCVYLYGTTMNDEMVKKIVDKMEQLPSSARVISVSAPLPIRSYLQCIGSFPLSFPWGETEGYFYKITSSGTISS